VGRSGAKAAPKAPTQLRRTNLVGVGVLAALIGGGVACGQAALVAGFDSLLPDARGINHFNRPGTLTILSADGQVVHKIGPVTREKLTPETMPPLVQQAFIAAEDRRFYQHDGIDQVGIGRAMVRNLRKGSVEEGASTITQQLARTVFLSQDRTLIRKLKEAALAGKLERQLSKPQILTEYLNVVYLGSSAYGVADAAWVYFTKTPDQLTLPEAALIAGLPPAPSVYSPLVNPDLALERRAVVLRRMEEAGFISISEQQQAEAAPLQLKPAEPKYWDSRAPYFSSWVQQELPKVLSPEQLEVGGLTERSSVNLAWQEKAQSAVNIYATGSMQVGGDILPRGLEVADHRHARANALEVVDSPVDVGSVRNGQEMEHRVGRSAGGHDQRDRVFDRLAGDDVARAQVVAHRLHQDAR
jgi:penicillin-binding protein 1A